MNFDLHIGQVIYIVSDKSTKVVPVVVSEQAVIKTLEGDSVTWKVILGPKEKRKVIDLDKINGEKFRSLQEAKMVLLKRFELFLNEATFETEKNVKDWYDIDIDKARQLEPPKPKQSETEFDADSLIDQIEQPSLNQQMSFNTQESLRLSPDDTAEIRRAKLRAMADGGDDDESMPIVPNEFQSSHVDPKNLPEGVKVIKGPNGEDIPVIME